MGYYVGLAKFSKHRNTYLILGLLVATIMHGTYDFFLFLDRTPYLAFGAFISLILGIIWSLKAIRKHAERSKQGGEFDVAND
jgi:RsiW-degrading membrane proteinase PrsW (M82 family)